MNSQLMRFGLGLASTAVCTIAFASTSADGSEGARLQQSAEVNTAVALSADDVLGSDRLTMPERLQLAQERDNGRNEGSDTDRKVFVYVCHVLNNGSFETQKMLLGAAINLTRNSNNWLMGRCENVISPS